MDRLNSKLLVFWTGSKLFFRSNSRFGGQLMIVFLCTTVALHWTHGSHHMLFFQSNVFDCAQLVRKLDAEWETFCHSRGYPWDPDQVCEGAIKLMQCRARAEARFWRWQVHVSW